MRALALNLGSTSTKLGVFEDGTCLWQQTLRHDKVALSQLKDLDEQYTWRKERAEKALQENGFLPGDMDIYAIRCGLIRPVEAGVYLVNNLVIEDARSGRYGQHAANLGLLIGHDWSNAYGVPAVFVDAPVTDELSDEARVSGYAGIERVSIFHALNARRVIRLHCAQKGLDPHEHNFIVAHMGGGITVAAFERLRAMDVNNGVSGEGPFSPERTGWLSREGLLTLCEQQGGDVKAVRRALYTQGGLTSWFGTNDVQALSERANTEPEVKRVLDAMLYQIAKQAGAMAAALRGQVDGVLLTGGLAFNEGLMDNLVKRLTWIAPCSVYPGEDELAALAEGAFRCLRGEEPARRIS